MNDKQSNVTAADSDPEETSEWIEALEAIVSEDGPARAQYILSELQDRARPVSYTHLTLPTIYSV